MIKSMQERDVIHFIRKHWSVYAIPETYWNQKCIEKELHNLEHLLCWVLYIIFNCKFFNTFRELIEKLLLLEKQVYLYQMNRFLCSYRNKILFQKYSFLKK